MAKFLVLLVLAMCSSNNVFSLECYTSDLGSVLYGSTTNFTHTLEDCRDYFTKVFNIEGHMRRRAPPQIVAHNCFTLMVNADDSNYVIKGCMVYNRCDKMKTSLKENFRKKGLEEKLINVKCTCCNRNQCNEPDSNGL